MCSIINFNMEKFNQWHESKKVEENRLVYFIKEHIPNSYEIKNEISWLTSNLFNSLDSFKVPMLKEASVDKGYIKMEYIDEIKEPNQDQILEYMIKCASELHSIIRTDQPQLRNKTKASEYIPYVEKFTRDRIETINENFNLDSEVSEWILSKINKLEVKYFSIVHRDLRLRHLLISNDDKPTLIDWEYSNISEPSQDLAKLIYDCVVNHKMNKENTIKEVIDKYSLATKISKDELEQKITTFLPIIPLEHCAAFIKRKPEGYESEVQKDLAFIFSLYEEEK